MFTFPQLRVRSEYSFGNVYGPVQKVVERLAAIGCAYAVLVDDSGTWGHVEWEKYCTAAGITPGFGAEKDGRWVIARDSRRFYNYMSGGPRDGVITFAGNGPLDGDYDFVDIDPSSILAADRKVLWACENKKPIILTGLNDYPAPDDSLKFLALNANEKMTPQHILPAEELRAAFWFLDDEVYDEALRDTLALGKMLANKGVKLLRAPTIKVDEPFEPLVEAGKRYRLEAGHIAEWTAEYEERLRRELLMIREKNYESYFIVVADLVRWAKGRMLVGPARGSSAGSLVCYLLQITEVDPLPHKLLFERFIDVNRMDLPDIDIDFSDTKRHLCFEYLDEKYGKENVGRIGNVNRFKPRSAMAHVGKKLGIPAAASAPVLNVLIEYSSGDSRFGNELYDTLHTTDPGREFLSRFPESSLVTELENHASHTGVHAAGIIVSNEPVTDFCTVKDGIAQVNKHDAEYLNLLKIDALGLRTLGVIEDAGVITAKELYGLKFDDPKVFDIFNQRKFAGVFQFEGATQRKVSAKVPVVSFQQIDHVTALARPGPLGSGSAYKYFDRNNGIAPVEYRHPALAEYLNDTLGMVLYQEQVMKIAREIGDFDWGTVAIIRKAMSASKGKEFFDRHGERFITGATRLGISESDAQEIWNEICTFGAWGMNKSHTVSYAIISYWCAYLKCYFPLEYAAACLRNANDEIQTIEILREFTKEGVEFLPFDPLLSEENWVARDGKLIGGFRNVVGIGPVKAAKWIAKRESVGLTDEEVARLRAMEVRPGELYPTKKLWADYYAHPEHYNIEGEVKEFAELTEGENACVIGKLIKVERRDENEALRIARRGGDPWPGESRFLDMHLVDDSVGKTVRARIRPDGWDSLAVPIANKAKPNADWFLLRGRWLDEFSLLIVKKVKCLSSPEII